MEHYSYPSKLINHVCQGKEIRQPTVYAKRPITNAILSCYRYKLVKMSSLQIQNVGSQRRCASLTLKASKPWMHHPPLTARRKYFIRVYPELWPTLKAHTAPVQSIQGTWTWGRRLQVTQKQQCPSSGCLLEGNRPPLIPTWTFMWSDRPVYAWLMAAVWAQVTPCLRVNRTATGVPGPSVLPISVNTN